ncbi:hypothetical protein MHM95_12520 [Pseudoalteromonas sp. CnMc7-15]|uniref:hypothetical protein n=1 Tax=unclassified Pseudoalteromonas TaxID=194690 RepID=UPI001EF6ABFD|nr:hypothetical protein [Pseudoalteromonas sp. CnMc7-15]MCG7567105.1 hypothetical protein [Pseudoalteromonas sp. CnMc7-15]
MKFQKELLNGHLGSPKGAAAIVKRRLEKRELSPSQAAKQIGVSHTTLIRFLDGGSLTTSLASKLSQLGLDIKTMFNLEAARQAHEAEQLRSA